MVGSAPGTPGQKMKVRRSDGKSLSGRRLGLSSRGTAGRQSVARLALDRCYGTLEGRLDPA